MSDNSPTLVDILVAQAKLEGKLDGFLIQITDAREDISVLYTRTNQHGKDITDIKSQLNSAKFSSSFLVSVGSVIVALTAVLITLWP